MCGRLLVAPRDKKARQSYQCTEFSADLHSVFGIDTHNDAVNIHPLKFCYRCKQVMDGSILAQCQHSHYTVSTIPYEWKKHTAEECQVCDITYMSKQVNTCVPIFIFNQICNPRSPQAIHVNLTLCPDSALDPFGHHAATCKRGGDAVLRHNKLRDILVESFHHIHVQVEAVRCVFVCGVCVWCEYVMFVCGVHVCAWCVVCL